MTAQYPLGNLHLHSAATSTNQHSMNKPHDSQDIIQNVITVSRITQFSSKQKAFASKTQTLLPLIHLQKMNI